MSKLLASKLNQGISPEQFVAGMTRNREAFQSWSERFAWPDAETEAYFASFNNRDDIRCMIIAADWCGDVVRNMPVLFRVNEQAGIPTEVMIMEQNLDLIDAYLTMGGRAIPIALYTDTGGHPLGQWGPRPAYVQEVMNAFKRDNPDREAPDYQEKIAVVRQEMGRRYGEDTAYQTLIVQELRELLSGF